MRTYRNSTTSTAALLILVFPVLASAHHSRAEYSDDVIELTGKLVDVFWRNPHAGLNVTLINDQGVQEEWRIETFGSPNLFSRMGVEREYFNIGEQVTISGRASTRRDFYMLGTNVLFENGLEAILSATIGPLWSNRYVGGSEHSDRELVSGAVIAAENRGIYRNWSIAGRAIGVSRNFPYTDEAQVAMAAWDPITAPVAQCETPGMPGPMYQPLSLEFVDDGATTTLNVEYFGLARTIHFDDAEDPATQPLSPLGYSVGRWEGNTLVVETSRINYPYFNSGGAPQSEEVFVVERFALSEDQSQLDVSMAITDSVTFTEPASAGRLYVALGEPFLPLDCTVF
ncbi:MAG: DUF6152 family protein [Gammaproteobacteria bacterium]|jgi:hypothetical protein